MFGGFGDWIIGVYLKFSTDGPATMARLSAASSAANAQLLRQQGLIDANTAAMLRYQRQIESVRARQLQLGTRIAGGLALGGAAVMIAGLNQAAKLQLAMVTVANATGGSSSQLAQLRDQVISVSDITAQSATTIAQEMAMAARAGLSSFQRLHTLFPLLARFADVQYFASQTTGGAQGMSPQQAIMYGTQFAHLFQAYDPKSMSTMLNLLNKLMFVQPEGMQRLLFQGKYFIPLFESLGLNARTPQGMQHMMAVLASMGQLGFLRGRGGTAIENAIFGAINAVQLTGHLQTAKTAALRQLGIITPGGTNAVDVGGRLDWSRFTALLQTASRRLSPMQFASDLKAAFNMQATQFLAAFNTPAVQAQVRFIENAMNRMGPIEAFFAKYVGGTLAGQVQLAFTNLANVLTQLGTAELPMVTHWFKVVGNTLGAVNGYLLQNKGAAKAWGDAIIGFTLWAAARWTLGTIQMSRSMVGFIGSMNALSQDVSLVTERILVDGARLRVGGGGGIGIPGVARPGPPAESGFVRFLRNVDNYLFGGLVQLLIVGGQKFMGLLRGIGARLIVDPLLKIGLSFEGIGTKLLAVQSPILRVFARIGLGIGRFSWSLGAAADGIIAALLKLSGPLSLLLSLTGDSAGPKVNYTTQGERKYLGDLGARIHRYGARRALQGIYPYDTTPAALHMHGDIHFNLPRGTPQAQARAAFQHFLSLTGAIGTSAYLPSPITVGGAAFGSR